MCFPGPLFWQKIGPGGGDFMREVFIFFFAVHAFLQRVGVLCLAAKVGPARKDTLFGGIYLGVHSFGGEFTLYPRKSLIAPCWRREPHMTHHNAFGWLLPLICQNLSRSCPSCGKLRASFQGFLENKTWWGNFRNICIRMSIIKHTQKAERQNLERQPTNPIIGVLFSVFTSIYEMQSRGWVWVHLWGTDNGAGAGSVAANGVGGDEAGGAGPHRAEGQYTLTCRYPPQFFRAPPTQRSTSWGKNRPWLLNPSPHRGPGPLFITMT